MDEKILYGFETDLTISDTDKSNLIFTDEGYLDCNDVIFAHVGSRQYHVSELGITDADKEIVDVYRTEDDLFSSKNIESIKGKPITDRHPSEMVNAKNWKKFTMGVVLDAYRDGDKLKGKLRITDEKKAKEVYDGKIRSVSLGYTAKLVKDSDDKYIFKDSKNNHIALVKKGRDSEAFIFDTNEYFDEKGGDEQVKENEATNQVNDALVKNDNHYEQKTESYYDTETGEEVCVTVTKSVTRRKVEENATLTHDEDKEQKDLENKENVSTTVVDENKKENNMKFDTILDLIVADQEARKMPQSPATKVLLDEYEKIAQEQFKTSLVQTEVKDEKTSPLNAVVTKPTEVNDEQKDVVVKTIKDEILITDEEKEIRLDEFYESLDPMNKAYHDSADKGLLHLTKISSVKAETLLKKVKGLVI